MKNAELEIIKFDSYDIITTSGNDMEEEMDLPPCVQGAWGMDTW